MKKTFLTLAAMSVAVVVFVASAVAAETNATPEQVEAKYTAAIEGRTADILKILALTDAEKSAKVHDTIMAQYRALKAWHEDNDPKLKAAKVDTNAVAQIRAALKVQHEKFLAALAEHLSPEQIEQVKDKLTYGKVQFTFNGYLSAYPNLADEHKQKILEFLKVAREEAMDGGSAEEKTAVFQKCKGKINNYLSKQGIHPEKKNKTASAETNALAK
jgi:Spy/CpxP family protein refolding chaperone